MGGGGGGEQEIYLSVFYLSVILFDWFSTRRSIEREHVACYVCTCMLVCFRLGREQGGCQYSSSSSINSCVSD